MPKISVIVPVYNAEIYLPECLDSLLNQTFSDIEIICINDGSSDNCAQILADYAKKDSRIKIITQTNKGVSIARNSGLDIASGEYISFIDSDDFVSTCFLEDLFNAIQNTGSDISGCDYKKIKNSGNTTVAKSRTKPKVYPNALEVLLNQRNFIHFNVWNKLYKRKIIGDIRFAEGLYFEDNIFNCCVFANADKFCWISDKLYAYRLTHNSIMRSPFSIKKIQDYTDGIKILHNYFLRTEPEKWQKIRQTRISRTVKMMMNASIRSHNKDILRATSQTLRQLYNQNLICYKGLSLFNKIKLFRFLHYKE